ncbi:unnamed protein product [Brachionus calyciflorus]|uniref:Uncharacterized protein n=1 Tax=Brachionus calyciflorus TaxID=104777 RepID=A0A814BGM2_9BILA|nr:unnamed protein product [Brachionus calyciflorus]
MVEICQFCISSSPAEFVKILDYFEETYIGKPIEDSPNLRSVPLYPIKLWNLNKRVLNDMPRSNNSIEAWHKALAQDVQSHPTIDKLLRHIQKEQSLTDTLIHQVEHGIVTLRKKPRF